MADLGPNSILKQSINFDGGWVGGGGGGVGKGGGRG